MRNSSLGIIGLVLAKVTAAQCVMSVAGSSSISCSGGVIAVNTTGGTGPYSIAVRKSPQNVLLGTFTDADGIMSVPAGDPTWWYNTGGASITVTDAVNCVASTNVSHAAFQASWTTPGTPSLDCATGNFRVTMSAITGFWPNTFRVDNGPVQNVAGNWTNLSASVYSLNTILAPGAHSITFPEQQVSGVTSCAVTHNVSVPTPVSPGDCGVNFKLKAALDGALPTGTVMMDDLRAAGLIPLTEPYSGLGYVYTGTSPGVSISPARLSVTGNDAVVDWVVVELRASLPPYGVLFSKPALLQRDGDVIDTDGDAYIATSSVSGSFRVAVHHRNHLGVVTGQSYSLDPTAALTVDLRNVATYGTNATTTKNGVNCMWAGDASGDGSLKYTGTGNDRDPIILAVGGTTPNNMVSNVYDRRDTNLDGVIKYTGTGNDRDIILTNVGSTTPNNTRVQQLP